MENFSQYQLLSGLMTHFTEY